MKIFGSSEKSEVSVDAGSIVTTLNQEIRNREAEIAKLSRLRDAAIDLPGKLRVLEAYEETLSALVKKTEDKTKEFEAYSVGVVGQKAVLDAELNQARVDSADQHRKLTVEVQDATKAARAVLSELESELMLFRKHIVAEKKKGSDELAELRAGVALEESRFHSIKNASEALKRM